MSSITDFMAVTNLLPQAILLMEEETRVLLYLPYREEN